MLGISSALFLLEAFSIILHNGTSMKTGKALLRKVMLRVYLGQNQTIWLAWLHSFQKGDLLICSVCTIIYSVKSNPDVNKCPDVE